MGWPAPIAVAITALLALAPGAFAAQSDSARRSMGNPLPAAPAVEHAPEALAAGCPGADSPPWETSVLQARTATLCVLNAERAKRGLPRLEHDGDLALAAARHASDMVRRDYFSHKAPGGEDFVDRIMRTDYVESPEQRWTLGENIGWGKRDDAAPRQIVKAWMRSPKHRANVLDERFRHAGIGISMGAPRRTSARSATYAATFGAVR